MKETFLDMVGKVAPITDAFRKDFYDKTRVIHLKKNGILVDYGDSPQRGFFIVSGSFKSALLTDYGSFKTVWFFFDELFPVIPIADNMIQGNPTSYRVTAMEDSIVIEMKNKHLRYWNQEYEEFSRFSRMDMIKDFVRMDEIRAHLIGYSKEDFVRFLNKKYPVILQRTPANTVADFMGITPEWYSKIRKKIPLIPGYSNNRF
ncbi:MAG: Crp/Fnr family transcriptional regulator [Bacteroidota bacterium]